MDRDSISALLTAVAVIALIVGFAVYFNSPELNTAGLESLKQQQQIEKILTPEPPVSTSSESTLIRGSSEQEMTRNTPVDLTSKRDINPVVIKLNRTKFDEIDKSKFRVAPNFKEVTGYINTNVSKPLDLQDLKGKVVLVDFWTYSCINCIRTIPYLNDWYEKYSDKGLTIVGIHTPEFELRRTSITSNLQSTNSTLNILCYRITIREFGMPMRIATGRGNILLIQREIYDMII